ncbi:MAG: beta-glucosidase family protein [Lishizhenia sp.]
MLKLLTIVFISITLRTFTFAQTTNISSDLIERKIDKAISKMSVEEKIGQTCQITLDALLKRDSLGAVIEPISIDISKLNEAIVEYKIGSILNVSWHTLELSVWKRLLSEIHQPYRNKQTSFPIIYGIDAIHGANYIKGGTLFPQEIGLAATWNPSLAKSFGEITAYETRAAGIPWNFSPVLDLGRQPLWSRFFETLGEDVYLASEMGESILQGYQGQNQFTKQYLGGCLKHFVGYSNPVSGRDRTPSWIPTKYMKELYLPPFEKAIKNGALTVMINSGDVNGIPGHANYHLLTEVLKKEWGFQGFTVSDWEDFIMLHTVHRTASSLKKGIVSAFNAGVDMSMVPYNPQYKEYCKLLHEALLEELVTMERLDDAVRRILRVKYALGLFEKDMGQQASYPDFGSIKHQEIALNSALESITLLKNDEVLPLNTDQKILVAGPTSNNLIFLNGAWTHTWQGNDTSFNTKNRSSIYEAVKNKVGNDNCSLSLGVELLNENGNEVSKFLDLEDFKSKAEASDIILLCLGELPATEKPGDINALDLTPEQIELAKIAYASNKPVVLILLEGRPRIIREIVDDAKAIVQCYLPGDFGADALVKLLFGEENFSGKLPYTYPRFNGQIEFYDHPRSVDRSKSNDFDAYNPQWNFGFGLGYTNFSYSNLAISKSQIAQSDTLLISVDVTNNGSIQAKEIIQLYISDHFASVVPNGKTLKRFKKVNFLPNETKTINFAINSKDLQFVGVDDKWISELGFFSIMIGDKTVEFELK